MAGLLQVTPALTVPDTRSTGVLVCCCCCSDSTDQRVQRGWAVPPEWAGQVILGEHGVLMPVLPVWVTVLVMQLWCMSELYGLNTHQPPASNPQSAR